MRTIREYTESIERTVMESRQRGCTQAVLYGESDIAFLVEYACSRYGVSFAQQKQVPAQMMSVPGAVLFIGE